ncbi:MAG: DoxX-like family [Chitinophagaceae bacterium]|nr:DoxX-like family [Chitinophagaceae bacterium]
MKLAKTIVIYIIGILFILTGAAKLLHLDTVSIEIFQRAKYPDWLYYLVAVTEMVGGALVLPVKTRRLGGLMLCGIMFGAVWTHHYLGDELWHYIAPALILLSVVWVVATINEK